MRSTDCSITMPCCPCRLIEIREREEGREKERENWQTVTKATINIGKVECTKNAFRHISAHFEAGFESTLEYEIKASHFA